MVEAKLEHGDNVNIIRGNYKNKHGIYRGPWGSAMARVKVEGDTREERHLLLTSIKKRDVNTEEDTTTITIERNELEMLREELMLLKITVKGMEDKINSLLN